MVFFSVVSILLQQDNQSFIELGEEGADLRKIDSVLHHLFSLLNRLDEPGAIKFLMETALAEIYTKLKGDDELSFLVLQMVLTERLSRTGGGSSS